MLIKVYANLKMIFLTQHLRFQNRETGPCQRFNKLLKPKSSTLREEIVAFQDDFLF